MNIETHGESFLLTQFREFYGEVVGLKRMIRSGIPVFPADGSDEEISDPEKAANFVRQRLLVLFENQERAAARRGEAYGSAIYEEARYVMAALADEIFLHLDWTGKTAWGSSLLEARLFRSHVAGEATFEKLDRLLQSRDPIYTELAKVYLMALALGFQGKYRGSGDTRELDAYRRKVFSYVARREPDLLNESRRLFPDAYAHTLEEGEGRRLPDLRRWIGALVLAVLVLGIIGHIIWISTTAELDQVIQRVLEG